MHVRLPRSAAAALVLAAFALPPAGSASAQDVTDPVDPIEDRALRQEAAARFDEALEDFRKAFDAAVEEAQQGGQVRERNLARAEVFLEKIASLTDTTTRQRETVEFLARQDAAKLGPLLQGQVDWHRAVHLVAVGDRATAEELAAGLGFVRDWWILGPFDNERGRGFGTSQPVETSIDLDAELTGKERPVRWRKVHVRPHFGLVDLDAMLRPNDQALAYGMALVRSETEQDGAVRLGSDEAVRAWWNGKEVLSRDVRRQLEFDQDVVPVRLRQGWNLLLVKCHDQTGPWAFRVRLTAPDGGRIAGVSFAADDAAAREALAGGFQAAEPAVQAAAGARAWYDQVTSGDSKRARDLFHLGLLHVAREFDSIADRRAEELLRRAAESEPTNAVYRFHYAEAAAPPIEMEVEKEENRQRQGREKTLEIDPTYAVAYRALASYYTTSLVNLERAEQLLRKALELNPGFVQARLDLASVLARRGLAARAEIERDTALRDARAGGLEATARARAALAEQRGLGTEALDAWNEVLRLDARGNDVRRKVAELAAAALKRDEALGVLDAITAQNPYDLSALRRKAELLEGADDFAGAREVLRKALDIAPEDDEVLQQLGRVEAKSGDRDAAVAAFRRALEVNQKLQRIERYLEYLDPEAAPYEDDHVVDVTPLLEKAAGWDNAENDGWLTVLDQTVTKVNRDGTSSNYSRQVVAILTDAGVKQYDRLWARGWGQLKWKWARVTRKSGDVVEAKIEGAQADFPPLQPGDVIDAAWRRDDREQSYFGDYFGDWQFFADYVPVLRSEWTLITPAERQFYFHQRNFAAKPVVTESEKDGLKYRTYSWRNEDVPKVRWEQGMPEPRENFPQVQVTTYRDWDEFAKWWSSMIRDQRKLTDGMKAKVAELTAGKTDRYEKIRAIYEFVTGEVTYQAWEFGVHGYKPYTTQSIFEKREGDCKDKALLLCTLLEEVGVECHPVLIYADQGRSEDDLTLAMVGQFNHCIAYVPDVDGKGTPLYLDGTAQYHSISSPPMMDRGATVLIVRPGGGEVARIPAGVPDDAGVDQTWKVQVREDGSGTLEGEMRWKGDFATGARNMLSVEGQRATRVQQMLMPLFGKITLESTEFDDLKDMSRPVATFRMKVEVPKLAKKEGDSFTLPSAFLEQLFIGGLPRMASLSTREHDLILPALMAFRTEVTYRLPEGWALEQKPEDAEVTTAAGVFRSRAAHEGGELRLERSFEISAPRVKKDEYAGFREALNRVTAVSAQRFKVKPGGAPAAPPSPAPPEAPQAPGDRPAPTEPPK